MSILSDMKILAKIYSKEFQIDPLQVENIQPSSIDLTLDEVIRIPKSNTQISFPYPDTQELEKFFERENISKEYILKPGAFVLGQIKETIALSDKLVGNIQNRNSLIRLGINVGLSGYINPGYKGKLPIAIHNAGTFDFHLVPGARICQLILHETDGVISDYGKRKDSKYHDEQEITLSKLSEDAEFAECVKKIGPNPKQSQLIAFLNERIEQKSKDFLNQISRDQRKALGL